MFISQIELVLLFAFASFLFLSDSKMKNSKTFFLLFFFVIVLLVVFRPETMADYDNYRSSFVRDSRGERYEPSLFVINKIVHICGDNALLGFFFYALIACFTKYKYLIGKAELLWGMMLVYISSTLVCSDMVAIRAGVAEAFLLLMIKYKCEQDTFKMILAFLLSVTFHYSAIILLFVFFLDEEKGRRFFYVLLLPCSYVLAFNGLYFTQLAYSIPFIGDYTVLLDLYSSELKQEDSVMNIFNLVQLCRICICVLFWMLVNKCTLYKKEFLVALKIYTIGICCLPLFANSTTLSVRLSELLFVVEILIIPVGFYSVLKSSLLYKISVVTFSAVLFIINLTNADYWHP